MLDGKLTTAEAAFKVGIHPVTLQRWIAARKVKAPKPTLVGAVGYRLWTADDVAGLKKIKDQIHRKGRGRKAKGETVKAALKSVKREFPELSHSRQRAIARTRALKDKLKMPIVK